MEVGMDFFVCVCLRVCSHEVGAVAENEGCLRLMDYYSEKPGAVIYFDWQRRN